MSMYVYVEIKQNIPLNSSGVCALYQIDNTVLKDAQKILCAHHKSQPKTK